LECNQLPLIDEEILATRRSQEKQAEDANSRLGEEVKKQICELDMEINAQLSQLAGQY